MRSRGGQIKKRMYVFWTHQDSFFSPTLPTTKTGICFLQKLQRDYLLSSFFQGILGYNRYINAVGDAEFNLVLMDYRESNNGKMLIRLWSMIWKKELNCFFLTIIVCCQICHFTLGKLTRPQVSLKKNEHLRHERMKMTCAVRMAELITLKVSFPQLFTIVILQDCHINTDV